MSNDGDGRDTDPSDPGDWVTGAEEALGTQGGRFANCKARDSLWHGTAVSGIIGAVTNNGKGIAGINWNIKLLPVRAFGKCKAGTLGTGQDIQDAIRWAAGITVGCVGNPTPARVINFSAGSLAPQSCSPQFQSAIDNVVRKGAVVVAATGNSGVDGSIAAAASCRGMIAVAATSRLDARASDATVSPLTALSGPGGEPRDQEADWIGTSSNSGLTVPQANNYLHYQGTSMAAPHVAGVAALMLAVNPYLSPLRVKLKLVSSVRKFPLVSNGCDTSRCGKGILDAEAAVRAALPLQAGLFRQKLTVLSTGQVMAWGTQLAGELCNGQATRAQSTPAVVTGLPPIRSAIASSASFFLGVDGSVWGCGTPA